MREGWKIIQCLTRELVDTYQGLFFICYTMALNKFLFWRHFKDSGSRRKIGDESHHLEMELFTFEYRITFPGMRGILNELGQKYLEQDRIVKYLN